MSFDPSQLRRQIRDLEAQLDFYRHHFPGVRELARENPPPVNGPNSENRANGGRNVNSQGNPLPPPPIPIWHAFTARNPNFVPPGNSQDRASAPSQPYAHQVSHLNENQIKNHADPGGLKDWCRCCLL